jgi:enoyl-CoA hydratase
MRMGLVNVERKDGVATLTLNNPTERNTMTAEMVADISAAMDDIDCDWCGPCILRWGKPRQLG